jgi:putative membrane protein
MDDLIATIDRTISDLKGADANAEANRAELKRVAAGASASIDKVRESYDGDLAGSLERAAGELTNAADEATRISGTLSEESTKVRSSLTATSADLVALEGKLDEAAAKVADVTGELRGLHERLTLAVSTGDMELVRTIMGADVSSLASFLSSPVELDREALYPVENNGSAMTPYYTTMALWVGGTLMGVLFYVAVSKKALEETAAGPTAAYFGRLSFFVCLGLVQALLLLLGDLFFLKVQCEHPVLFVVTGCVGSVVFVNIIFALATALGDVGKAIAVFIMVIQVAGSGGTFPREMLPPVFQAIYPYLPFVHAEDAFRAAMFGTYGNDWAKNVAVLACFLPCALIIGTVLARLFAPANEWIERKLEETKLM